MTDPDESISGTTWQWAKSNDSTNWTNVGTNSDSYTPVDGEIGYSLRATASYTDGHGPGKIAQATTTQPVRAGTNRAPDFGGTTADREVAENSGGGVNVGDPVTATDDDNHTLTYTLEGTDAGSFQIVSTSGQIQTKSGVSYDHETKDSYSATVKTDDNKGGTDAIDVTITVTDVNEKPEFDGTTTTREVAENTAANTDFGDPVEATDEDDGDILTYSLGGTDGSSFDIDTSTGQLKTRVALDKETKSSYTVTVSVHDGLDAAGGADTTVDDTITVTINITDVNEPPQFPSTENGARSVAENTAANQDIGTPVTANDPENDDLTYSLGGTDAADFDIDTSTGQLKTKSGLDKETKSSYSVTVSVKDGKNDDGIADANEDADDTQTVTITVTDANEPPVVTGSARESHSENDATAVATYSATDPDGTPTTFTWTLSGDDEGDFAISNTGVLTFDPAPNYEDPADRDMNNVYLVTVEASDGTAKGSKDVTVTVTNVNEKPAFPTSETGARSITENTAAGQNIGDPVAATDPDAGAALTYALGGTDAADFDIDTSTGQLKTKSALDRETKSSYTVTVSVHDGLDAVGEADTTVDDTIHRDHHGHGRQ